MKTCGISTAFVAVAWGWLAFAQAAQDRPPDKGDGRRVVHVGNSHSHALRFIEPLAWAVGHAKHKDGEVNILGAPLQPSVPSRPPSLTSFQHEHLVRSLHLKNQVMDCPSTHLPRKPLMSIHLRFGSCGFAGRASRGRSPSPPR